MGRNFILKRILSMVAMALAMATILIAGIYAVVTPGKVAKAKVQELLPRAWAAADLVNEYMLGNISMDVLTQVLGSEQSILNSYMYTFFRDSETILYTQREGESSLPSDSTLTLLKPYRDTVLSGAVVTTTADLRDGRGNCLLVGVPIYRESRVIGAVFLTKTLAEVNAAFQSLNITLFISLLTVFFVMLFLTYFASRVITRPIVQMRGVALAIAGGDFSARANETIRGEIGELGRTLNYLAARLDESMTAIILERNRLMQLFDGLNEGILALDVDGNITHANPALYNLMGCDESMPISQLRSTDFLTRALTDVDVIISTRSSAIKQLVCGDKMIRVILSPMLNSREECEGVVVLFSDISESERLEQTRREYVANVSHELKTPVSSLIGLAETLNDNILTEEADRRRYYSLILKESQRLSRLIDDLLELSRLQEGRGRADIIRVNLLELVHESLEVFQQTARESGVTLMVDESFTDCPRALTDPDRVDQVLVILTDNALRFTPRGGWIKYSAAWDETTIRITVEDSGCGIAQKDLPHVFDRFYKADTSYASPGTGLGLSIAQKALGLIGQRIWVKSEPGHGAAFTFTVRRADPQ
ncbi:cell wall metabolism sensor histidine kinase WalK [Christensenella sp. MSJ-20]|uniref:sensor histidine kinase n=1 Tax=Christensenella sp. MSJ-20 TaxID=2841518 RepID=UPI001C787850|nr:cell wall metabolism sensor histidine kinase WalK [Christensenella sp. MSJ-20]